MIQMYKKKIETTKHRKKRWCIKKATIERQYIHEIHYKKEADGEKVIVKKVRCYKKIKYSCVGIIPHRRIIDLEYM